MQRIKPASTALPCGKYAVSGINLSFAEVIPYPMQPEERDRMYELCALIEKEKDHVRFQQLINELNELLERREQQLDDNPGP
jgi:hypothetical protein